MEKQEMQEMLFNDLGESMNQHFTKEQMRRFYKLLKKVHKIILWQNTVKHGFFKFEEIMYINSKKFKVRASNVKPGNITGDYYEDDRFPVEVLVVLPLENDYNGLKSNSISLKSEENLLGGMNYNDFMDFMKVYKGWLGSYKTAIFKEANTHETIEEEPKEQLVNNFLETIKEPEKMNIFNLKDESDYYDEEEREYYKN